MMEHWPEQIANTSNEFGRLLAAAREAGGQREELDTFVTGLGDTALRLYVFWANSALALFNVMMPIDIGGALDGEQLKGISDTAHFMGGRRCTPAVHAVQPTFKHLSQNEPEEVGAMFAQAKETDPRFVTDMLIVMYSVLHVAATKHSVSLEAMSVRAAMFRMQMAQARTYIRETDWCGECLPDIMNMSVMLDDQEVTPIDGRVSANNEDMSFLNGINLEGLYEEGTTPEEGDQGPGGGRDTGH